MEKRRLTDEQNEIVESSRTAHTLIVNALAGSGKTATALACVRANRDARGVYFSFNKANADEMRAKLWKIGCDRNMKAMTIHSLAFQHVARGMLERGWMQGFLRAHEIGELVSIRKPGGGYYDRYEMLRVGKIILNGLSDWCHSSERDIGKFCDTYNNRNNLAQMRWLEMNPGDFFDAVRFLWQQIQENPAMPLTHDAYLKIFHVNLDSFIDKLGFDFVIADEAQDLFPVAEDIVVGLNKKGSRLLCLGDRHQQIYAWNKSINTMSRMEKMADRTLSLTQSFRCSREVVEMSTPWLRLLGYKGGFRPRTNDIERDDFAVLSRTNAGVMGTLCQCFKEGETPDRIFMVGGAKSYNFGTIRDRIAFMEKRTRDIEHPGMRRCKSEAEYDLYALYAMDKEMEQARHIVDLFPKSLVNRIIGHVERDEFTTDQSKASVCISTAHKSKGLEFGHVSLGVSFEDFTEAYAKYDEKRRKLTEEISGKNIMHEREMSSMECMAFERKLRHPDGNLPMAWNSEEFRLNYVAITRAIHSINAGKVDILDNFKFSHASSLLDGSRVVLYDRDVDGNIQSYEPRAAQYAKLIEQNQKNRKKPKAGMRP